MSETILVVDDEEVNRELLEAILTEDGYQVQLAPDGPSALAQASAAPPALVLLDLLMPGMHGLEVCQRLKQTPITAAIPVIVVTAVGQVTAKEAALTTGADDFISKPIDPPDLRARVRAMLKVRRIRQELDRTLAYLHELEAIRHAERRATLTRVTGGLVPPPADTAVPIPVLLIDDEAMTRDFYGDLLAEHGFRVFAAQSGSEGLALAKSQPVEVVVLDILMPEMSGLEVLGTLRAGQPDLPVIILTGHPTSQNAIAALKLGAFDFIVKGLDHSLVVFAVHRAVRHRREALQRKEEMGRLQEELRALQARTLA